jgi:hypothetical protein
VTGDDEPRDAAQQRDAALGTDEDDHALVERLRSELDAARERITDAWQHYRRQARDPGLPAIAGSPLLPALLTLLTQQQPQL